MEVGAGLLTGRLREDCQIGGIVTCRWFLAVHGVLSSQYTPARLGPAVAWWFELYCITTVSGDCRDAAIVSLHSCDRGAVQFAAAGGSFRSACPVLKDILD